jgi:hypothetical protein
MFKFVSGLTIGFAGILMMDGKGCDCGRGQPSDGRRLHVKLRGQREQQYEAQGEVRDRY